LYLCFWYPYYARWEEKRREEKRREEKRRDVGGEAKAARVRGKHGPMPRVGAFDLQEGSAAAALNDSADPPQCEWLLPRLLREPVLYP
jgi:hypothetical protein